MNLTEQNKLYFSSKSKYDKIETAKERSRHNSAEEKNSIQLFVSRFLVFSKPENESIETPEIMTRQPCI